MLLHCCFVAQRAIRTRRSSCWRRSTPSAATPCPPSTTSARWGAAGSCLPREGSIIPSRLCQAARTSPNSAAAIRALLPCDQRCPVPQSGGTSDSILGAVPVPRRRLQRGAALVAAGRVRHHSDRARGLRSVRLHHPQGLVPQRAPLPRCRKICCSVLALKQPWLLSDL